MAKNEVLAATAAMMTSENYKDRFKAEYIPVSYTHLLPLYDNAPSQECRTFDSIITQLFTVGYGKRLQKVTTNKGEVYYGGKGIIFDESYTPLLLCLSLIHISLLVILLVVHLGILISK